MNQQNTQQAPVQQFVRALKAPPADVVYAHKLGRGMLLPAQVEELVKAINPAFVQAKQGKAYLAQHQARAEMNRIFGYGNWDLTADDPFLLYEEQRPGTGQNSNKMYWIAGYRMKVTVDVRDLWGMPIATYTGTHAEENASLPNRGEAHAMAITSVESYAMRRAMINLGDRFGLGLYNAGSQLPHGQYTIQLQPGVLFEWQPVGAQAPQTAPPTQPSHETLQAEPAHGDDNSVPEHPGVPTDYDDAESDGQGGTRSRTYDAKMQAFHGAQQRVQGQRDAARQQPAQQGGYPAPAAPAGGGVFDRLQSGFKQDQRGTPDDADVNRYGDEQVPGDGR